MKSIFKSIILLLCVVPFVNAQVVISQVLYDPIGTESGGEAVELLNNGDLPVDISGWVIASESSAKDATIPDGSVLAPGVSFLIADEGWNDNKDEESWRSADYEEKLTLGNSGSGIALLDASGSVVDAVGWGDEEEIDSGLFEGSPALEVKAGMVLLRVKDTGDNSVDFAEALPDFQEGIAVPVSADVTVFVPVLEVSKSLTLNPDSVLSVKNNGESAVNIKIVLNDLKFKNYTISRDAIEIEELEFTVEAGSKKDVKVRLRIPSNVVPGKYLSTFRIITSYFGK